MCIELLYDYFNRIGKLLIPVGLKFLHLMKHQVRFDSFRSVKRSLHMASILNPLILLMVHPLIAHFQMLGEYNRLANQRLYSACGELTDAERKQIRPAFFKSIHGTLNHIMIGDRIWMTRFSGGEIASTGLDTILYNNFEELWQVRQREDAQIKAFFDNLDENFLGTTIRYRNNAGNLYEDPVELLVMHFFNHQTHHRGQIHDMLSQTPVKPPSLDMHRILRP